MKIIPCKRQMFESLQFRWGELPNADFLYSMIAHARAKATGNGLRLGGAPPR